MTNERIADALSIARERHQALVAGDADLYMSLDESLGLACRLLLGAGAEALTEHDVPQLDELIALETQSRRLLQALMDDASARMTELRRNGRANNAYAAHERFSVNGV